MNYLQTIILSIIEGLTEFLPISSTAHMKIANPLIGVQSSTFTDMFEVVVQLAAILAVVVLYFKKFFDFSKAAFYLKLMIAVIPALVFGFLLKKHIDASLSNLVFISVVMIAGGVVLLFVDNYFKNPQILIETRITNKQSLIIGCFQVLSIVFPGLSRSAATIVGGMSQKLSRKVAAEFSFFLAVPTMIAASAKSFMDACKNNYLEMNNMSREQGELVKPHLKDIFSGDNLRNLFNDHNLLVFGIGCTVSFMIALVAVKFFITYLQKHGFKVFGWYRIVLGIVVLILISQGIIKQ